MSCFEAKTRRRRNARPAVGTVSRKAFRVCVHDDDLVRLLNVNAWPDISISEWFLKSKPLNAENDKDKRALVDSECLLHEVHTKLVQGEVLQGL